MNRAAQKRRADKLSTRKYSPPGDPQANALGFGDEPIYVSKMQPSDGCGVLIQFGLTEEQQLAQDGHRFYCAGLQKAEALRLIAAIRASLRMPKDCSSDLVDAKNAHIIALESKLYDLQLAARSILADKTASEEKLEAMLLEAREDAKRP